MSANITTAQIRKIFKLAKERALDNDTLHSYIYSITTKSSIKELTIIEAIKIIDSLEENKSVSESIASYKQLKFINSLAFQLGWTDENKKVDENLLNSFIKKHYNVDNIKWLDKKIASKVIEGMKVLLKKDKKKK